MNEFVIKGIKRNSYSTTLFFSVPEEYKRYFNSDWLYFEYNRNINSVPDEIALMPFWILLAPIIWTLGLTIKLKSIDSGLFWSLSRVKSIMSKSYPLHLTGQIISERFFSIPNTLGKSGLFFSGGVDATHSYIQLYENNPGLIVMRGFDFSLTNNKVWENFSKKLHPHISRGEQVDIVSSPNLHNINFTELNNKFQSIIADMSWWSCYEVGLYTIAHSVVPAFLNKYSRVYLSSSYPKFNEPIYGASSSIIDAFNLSWCDYLNAGENKSRSNKIKDIIYSGKYYPLRVCWHSKDGKNCCECEKCARTIVELYVCGADASNYGFNLPADWFQSLKKRIQTFTFPAIEDWFEISKIISSDDVLMKDSRVNWLSHIKFDIIHATNSIAKSQKKRQMNW